MNTMQELIKEGMKKSKLSARKLSTIIGVDHSRISDGYLKKCSTIPPKILRKISKCIDVNYNTLQNANNEGFLYNLDNEYIAKYYDELNLYDSVDTMVYVKAIKKHFNELLEYLYQEKYVLLDETRDLTKINDTIEDIEYIYEQVSMIEQNINIPKTTDIIKLLLESES